MTQPSFHTRRAICAAALLAFGAAGVFAQAFPNKPVRLIVPFAAGGGTDILARNLAPKLGEILGQPVIIDNRAGAGGNIGADAVAKAAPDGYTLLLGSNTLSINPSLYKGQAPDPIKSFTPIGVIATAPMVLVTSPDLQIQSVKDLIAKSKSAPAGMNWATPGNGTPHHLAEELFNKLTGAKLTIVQYKGGGPAINDVLSKQTQASVLTYSSVKGFIDSGKLRALGVATASRTSFLPDVPTIAEAGVPGYKADLWYGIFAPAGTPAAIVKALNDAFNKTLMDKAMQQRFAEQGYESTAGTPEQLANLLHEDLTRSAKLIAETGIKAD
jgi:tripartite-type tricarboxylate transporter receptor subunit TctC